MTEIAVTQNPATGVTRRSVALEEGSLPEAPADRNLYVVKPKDTFASVCGRYGITNWGAAAKTLEIDPQKIEAGQILDFNRVLGSRDIPAGGDSKSSRDNNIHVVQRGQNFSEICEQHGIVNWQAAARQLQLDPNRVIVGQKIDFAAVGHLIGKSTDNNTSAALRPESPYDSGKLAETAIKIREHDNAHDGKCYRGVKNILRACGVDILEGGSAYMAIDQLEALCQRPGSGWLAIDLQSPKDAPNGAVLCYDRNPSGQRSGGGGAEHGHIEIHCPENGTRHFISDDDRHNYGGSVPENWNGKAYVYTPLTDQNLARRGFAKR